MVTATGQDAPRVKAEEADVEALRVAYLRTLARGWSKGHRKQAIALDALLDGKKVAKASKMAGMNAETCRKMWKRFQAFAVKEEQRSLARKVVPLEEDDTLEETLD